MKVLQINSVCGVGSTGRIATHIHELLKNQDHESYIAYGRGGAHKCESAIKIGNYVDNYVHVALTRVFDYHGMGSEKATRVFIKEVEALNPDVIHLHNIHGYYLNIEILFNYLKKAGKPVVWTLHDCWPFTGHCAYFDYANCEKWKASCYECSEKNAYPPSWVCDQSSLNHQRKKRLFSGIKSLKIVTPSTWLAGLVEDSFLGEYPIEVIHNGLNLSLFKPMESDFRKRFRLENKFLILGVASVWDHRKGLSYFIEMAESLKEDEVIVLVGLSKKQKSQLPSHIVGIEKTHSIQELAEIYSEANVFVNPTLEDNFPTTNLEALACGTPVITFDTGGSVESVDKETGFVVAKKDVKGLIKKMRKIKEGKVIFHSDKLRLIAKERYDEKKNFNHYVTLYQGMLGE